MSLEDLIEELESQAPAEAQDIARNLLRLGAEHWEHDYQTAQGDERTKWLNTALETLMTMHTGKFGGKFPKDYIAQVPNYKALLAPMPWDVISHLTAKAVRAMYRMPDYSCGSLFYPSRLDRWLMSDNRGSRTSCFLRMLVMEPQAPAWTLGDLAKAPSKERALIARVKDALDAEDVKQLVALYASIPEPIQPHTFWGRVGQVAAWLQTPEVQATRGQFGEQLNRIESKRHTAKWDRVARLPELIGQLCVYNGQWRGWFPVPSEKEFHEALSWLAMKTGAYLYVPEETRPRDTRAGTSGLEMQGVGVVEELYLGDYEESC